MTLVRLPPASRQSEQASRMESLYLLLPLSLVFVALIGGVLWWSIFAGQYDDPDAAGQSILSDDDNTIADTPRAAKAKESVHD